MRIKLYILCSAILLGLAFSEMQSYAAQAILPESVKEYRYEKEWGNDVSMKGLFAQESMYFQVGNWSVKDAIFEVKLNASQLINEEVSYMTISLNGIAIETTQVVKTGKGIKTLMFVLPAEKLNYENTNTITIETYLRGQKTDACVDDSSVSTWINIFKESKVVLDYVPLLECNSIADFYEKFLSIEALTYEESLIATGSSATEGGMSAIAQIVSAFAQNTVGDYENVKSKVIRKKSDITAVPFVMYVDAFNNLPAYLVDAMTPQQKEAAGTQGFLCLVELENTKVLVVTGNNDEEIKKAAELLSNKEVIPMIANDQYAINMEDHYKMKKYEREEYIELTSYGVEVKGNFKQSANFTIDYPGNRKLSESAELSLDFRHSKNIDYKKSLLTVYVDGNPIGSCTLSKETAEGTTVKIPIPSDLQVVGSFTIETVFNLYPLDDWCELTPEEVPWGYIAETSMLKWTTMENTELFMEYYPFPFIRNGAFSKVKVLLPQKWKEEDLQTMIAVVTTMGKWLRTNTGEIEVLFDVQEEKLKDSNVISIAKTGLNPLQTDLPIMEKGSGGGQLIFSPYSEELNAILTITGGDEKGMLKTLNWLGKAENIWELKGDVFYTNGEKLTCQYTRTPKESFEIPKPEKTIETKENIPVVIVGSIFILILLSAAMLLIKYGRTRRLD